MQPRDRRETEGPGYHQGLVGKGEGATAEHRHHRDVKLRAPSPEISGVVDRTPQRGDRARGQADTDTVLFEKPRQHLTLGSDPPLVPTERRTDERDAHRTMHPTGSPVARATFTRARYPWLHCQLLRALSDGQATEPLGDPVSGLIVTCGDISVDSSRLPFPVHVEHLGANVVAMIGQQGSLFPLEMPVKDGNTLHCLRGAAWEPAGLPTGEQVARALVTTWGRALLDGTLVIDGRSRSGLFTLCSASPETIAVTSDPSGLYPTYLWAQPGKAMVSSHERVLARIVGANADLRGVVQTAAFGYAIGERTLHLGIRQLPAGATARIDVATGFVTVTEHPTYYGPVREGIGLDDLTDATWDSYQRGVKAVAPRVETAGLLMSGGFDTRLVTLGLANAGRPLVALTIGDPDNHEVGVAERVAHLSGASWQRRTATPDLDGLESAAAEMLAVTESLCFPTCWFGGVELRDRGATTLSTGYGGETVLGGQGYGGFLGAGSRWERLASVIQRGAQRSVPERRSLSSGEVVTMVEAITDFHRKGLRRLTTSLADDLAPVAIAEVDLIKEDIETEVHRYLAAGPTALEQIAERFLFEHHVRKHFGRQELTLDAVLPIVLPTIGTELLLQCTTTEPVLKVEHRLYLRMIKRHFGPYGRIPTSNVPVRLDLPAPILWASRSARALWDDRQVRIQQQTSGQRGRRFGWSNYEIWARESNLFDALPRLIAPWLVKPEWLKEKLTNELSWKDRFFSGQDHLVLATVSGMVDP